MGALGTLYDLDIDYYVAVDLNSFRNVVNTLGGVVVDVQVPVYDSGYPADDGRGKLKLYMPPGMVKMNGQQALAYARSRHETSDFDRVGAPAARHHLGARPDGPRRTSSSRASSPSSSRRSARTSRRTSRPSMLPKLLSLAQKIDLDRRENLVLSRRRRLPARSAIRADRRACGP